MKLREGVVAPAAAKIIALFDKLEPDRRDKHGTVAVLARRLGMTFSAVWRWTVARPVGTGGLVPAERQVQLLKLAKEEGIALDPAMFFEGTEKLTVGLKFKTQRRGQSCKADATQAEAA